MERKAIVQIFQMSSNNKSFVNKSIIDNNSKSDQKLRMKTKIVLKRLTNNEIEKYDKYFFDKYLAKHSKSVSKSIQINAYESQVLLVTEIESKNSEKPKTHSMKDYFMRYLNVIQSNDLKNRSIDKLKAHLHAVILG